MFNSVTNVIRSSKTYLMFVILITSKFAFADISISEIYINPQNLGVSGAADNGQEFVELKSSTGGVESLSGLPFIILDGDGAGSTEGTVDIAIALDSYSTGSNGLLVISDNNNAWNPPADAATTLIIQEFLNDDGSGDDIENGTNTYAIVEGYTGFPGQDLDLDDDGILDSTPWSNVVDAIGVQEHTTTTSTEMVYGAFMGFSDINGSVLGQDPDAIVRVDGQTFIVGALDADEDGLANGPYQLIAGAATATEARRFFSNLNPEFTLTPGSINQVSPFSDGSGESKNVPAMGFIGITTLFIGLLMSGLRLTKK